MLWYPARHLPSKNMIVVLSIIILLLQRPSMAQETFTSGVFSAWMGDYSPELGMSGDVNVFVTDNSNNNYVGFNSVLFGLPPNEMDVRIVIHTSVGDCENRGDALVYGRNAVLNQTVSSSVEGVAELSHFETFDGNFNKEVVRWNTVAVYLANGTLAGCGSLHEVADSSVLTSYLNAFPNYEDGFQADVTFVTYPDHPILCYFGTAVGVEPNVGSGDLCSVTDDGRPPTTCGVQIRSQTTCEADLMQDTVHQPDNPFQVDPWTFSKYFWSTASGFTVFSRCLDIVADTKQDQTFDLVVGQSLIAYDTEGVGIGCGSVVPYEAPTSALKRSDVYCGYLHNDNIGVDIWGAVFVYQTPEILRNGVLGVSGHGYGLENECNDDCEVVLYEADSCDSDLGDPLLTGDIIVDSTGSFFGVLDAINDSLEDVLVAILLGNGDLAACDYLKEVTDDTVYQAKTTPYSGRTGSGEIVSTSALDEDLCSFGVVYGLEPNIYDCDGACFYHVNEGTSCDELKDHLYNKDAYDESPWQESRYVSTDEYGVGFFGGCVETALDPEYDYSGLAVVVRGPDNLPSSCGLLTTFEPFVDNSTCNICPLDGYAISKPNDLANFGGQVDVTCTALKQTADSSYLASTDQCIELQQVASWYCGCSLNGLTSISTSSSTPRTIGVVAALAAVLLVAGAGYFCWTKSKQSGKMEKTVDDLVLEQQQSARDGGVQQHQISESLVSPVATAVHESVVYPGSSNSTGLTGKNQLQGESFWQDRGAEETPYAQVVAIEPSHDEGDSKSSAPIKTTRNTEENEI